MRTRATLRIVVGWAVLAAGWPASTHAQQTTIEQAGHWIHSDEPDEFGKIVMSFLESA